MISARACLVAACALELAACEAPVRFPDDDAVGDAVALDVTRRDSGRGVDATARDARGADAGARIDVARRDVPVRDAPSLSDAPETPDVATPDAPPWDAAADAPPPTFTFCDGLFTVTDPAKPLGSLPRAPWDGAPVAAEEILPRVRELRVGPADGVWSFDAPRAVFHAYARTDDGRWYDVTDASSWVARTETREYSVYFESPGRVARTEPDGGAGFSVDGATHVVIATFEGFIASRRWDTSGISWPSPLEVLGDQSIHPCERQQLGVLLYDSFGTHAELRTQSELRAQVRFAVSDPSVVAVGDDGVLVALRPGTAEVSATARYARCGEESCRVPTAIYPLVVTVLPAY